MDALAVKQACKFAKDHALANGPIVSTQETELISVFLDFIHACALGVIIR
jgi:hypothetical protein